MTSGQYRKTHNLDGDALLAARSMERKKGRFPLVWYAPASPYPKVMGACRQPAGGRSPSRETRRDGTNQQQISAGTQNTSWFGVRRGQERCRDPETGHTVSKSK